MDDQKPWFYSVHESITVLLKNTLNLAFATQSGAFMTQTDQVFSAERIFGILRRAEESRIDIALLRDILARASERKGLPLEDMAALIFAPRDFDSEMFAVSADIRNKIYGNRMVLFAPLYWSSYCANDCLYCSFRTSNRKAERVRLSLENVADETRALLDSGHKRILLESGEHTKKNTLDYLLKVIETIYSVQNDHGDKIRRVNVNVAAADVETYRSLRSANIGTYNLFQETYHAPTYVRMHPTRAFKGDFVRQVFSMDRAIEGGLQDLGMGVLYGLYDWRFEILALISHARYLEDRYGIGPHTISVPRICEARGADFQPPCPVSDPDFLRIIAIIRMALPYAGMVVSTREPPAMRLKAFEIGISQTSAGSRTTPGGYSAAQESAKTGQFITHDGRTLDEVTYELLSHGFIPSHCTACEFMGREGLSFMPLARSGDIRFFCQPNSLVTLKEYLRDYASEPTRRLGEQVIARELGLIPDHVPESLGAESQALAPDGLKAWTADTLEKLSDNSSKEDSRAYYYI